MESVATIGHETVLSLLPMSECIDLIASALEALERGSADMPLRFGYSLPLADEKTGILASMPSFMRDDATGEAFCASKVITVFPTNKQARTGSSLVSASGVQASFVISAVTLFRRAATATRAPCCSSRRRTASCSRSSTRRS